VKSTTRAKESLCAERGSAATVDMGTGYLNPRRERKNLGGGGNSSMTLSWVCGGFLSLGVAQGVYDYTDRAQDRVIERQRDT